MAIRLPSESRLHRGYVPPLPDVISTGAPDNEGFPASDAVFGNMSVWDPAVVY